MFNVTNNSRAQHGAHNACTYLGAYQPNTCLTITNRGRGGPESKEAWGEKISSHERSRDAMTFDDSTSDDDVATDERAIERYTSSPLSTCLVLAFVALAVVTLGALTCFQTNFPTRANLDRASTMRRNASKRVTTATIATPSRALMRPSFAVCVVGQVRAMARRDVREHARAALTTPLVEDGGDVEVFLHSTRRLWTTSWKPRFVNFGHRRRSRCTRWRIVEALDARVFERGWRRRFDNACAEDVRQRERIRNKTFDWIVLTRPTSSITPNFHQRARGSG